MLSHLWSNRKDNYMWCFRYSFQTYRWPSVVESTHGDFEASSLCDQDVLLRYPHILKGDASGVRAPLTHVHLLQARNSYRNILSCGMTNYLTAHQR